MGAFYGKSPQRQFCGVAVRQERKKGDFFGARKNDEDLILNKKKGTSESRVGVGNKF